MAVLQFRKSVWGLPIYKKRGNRFQSTGIPVFSAKKHLVSILTTDEGLAVYIFSVPCLQCLYNFQLHKGRSITWFKEAANAEDVIKKHSREMNRRKL